MSELAGHPQRPWGAQFVLVGGCVAVALLLVSAVGTRLDLWDFRLGLLGVMAAGILGALLTLWGLVVLAWVLLGRRRTAYGALLGGLALASFVFVVLALQTGRALSVPRMHDVTTAPEDPPRYDVLREARGPEANDLAYDRETLEPLQRDAYPFVQPVYLDTSPAAAFERALAAARAQGWDVVAADPGEGRIEATDTSFWFGFVDDVVIRLRPEEGRVRVDVRSVSRVGESDLGANAHRIRRYLERLGA